MDMFDSLNLTLTNPVLPQQAPKPDNAPRAQKEQFAKDFESIFMEKLLDEMKNTIGNWGFEPDAASKQIQGLFFFRTKFLCNAVLFSRVHLLQIMKRSIRY